MADPKSRHVELGGSSIHYREGGKGPPVLLVHGWIESSWCWLRIWKDVAREHRAFALDLVGFGQSTPPEGTHPFDVHSNAEVVERFLEERVRTPAHIVGHSMGGMIALILATRRPELIRSLTLMSAPIDGPNAVARLLQLVGLPVVRDSTFRLLRSRGVARFLSNYFVYKTDVPDHMIEDAMRMTPEALFGSARSILSTNLAPLLSKVRVPSLVLFGDKDRVVDIGQGALAADRIRDAEFRILRNCGHCPQIEEPYQVGQALNEFFREASGVPPRLMGVTF